MDEMEQGLTAEEKAVVNALGVKLQANNALEAQAIVGYQEQRALIEECIGKIKEVTGNELLLEYLEQLKSATDEKISDELNHTNSLNAEFVELTGIPVATT